MERILADTCGNTRVVGVAFELSATQNRNSHASTVHKSQIPVNPQNFHNSSRTSVRIA